MIKIEFDEILIKTLSQKSEKKKKLFPSRMFGVVLFSMEVKISNCGKSD